MAVKIQLCFDLRSRADADLVAAAAAIVLVGFEIAARASGKARQERLLRRQAFQRGRQVEVCQVVLLREWAFLFLLVAAPEIVRVKTAEEAVVDSSAAGTATAAAAPRVCLSLIVHSAKVSQ